jgi:hypothetical protein
MDMGMIEPTMIERKYIRAFERKHNMIVNKLLTIQGKMYVHFEDLYAISVEDIVLDIQMKLPYREVFKYLDDEMDAAMYGIDPPMDYITWARTKGHLDGNTK